MSGQDFLNVTHLSYLGDGEWALRFNGESQLFWEMVEQLRADTACWKRVLFRGRSGWVVEEELLFTYRDRFTNLAEQIRLQGFEPEEVWTLMDVPLALQAACSLLHLPLKVNILQVRKQYRTLSKLYHPDTGGDQRYFVALQYAYEQIMAYVQADGGQKTA